MTFHHTKPKPDRWLPFSIDYFFGWLPEGISHDWEDAPPIYKNAKTTAQLLAVAGNLDCQALCVDMADLAQCYRLAKYSSIPSGFVDKLQNFNLQRYCNQDNCNNGQDLFKYYFGREGTNVIYIEYFFNGDNGNYIVDNQFFKPLTKDGFIELCTAFGKKVKANESWLSSEEKTGSYTQLRWRLWWD